jgi:hypothetical protein
MAKRPSITDVRGLGDFMVSNLWVVEVIAPTGVAGLGFDKLNLRAVSFEIPKKSGNSLEINIRGAKVKQPGDYDYSGQVTLTLAETEKDQLAHNLIRGWREAIIETNTNAQMRKSDIECVVIIKRLNRQNQLAQGATSWKLWGVYLEDYELGELTDAGDVIQPTITLSYDFFEELGYGHADSVDV